MEHLSMQMVLLFLIVTMLYIFEIRTLIDLTLSIYHEYGGRMTQDWKIHWKTIFFGINLFYLDNFK